MSKTAVENNWYSRHSLWGCDAVWGLEPLKPKPSYVPAFFLNVPLRVFIRTRRGGSEGLLALLSVVKVARSSRGLKGTKPSRRMGNLAHFEHKRTLLTWMSPPRLPLILTNGCCTSTFWPFFHRCRSKTRIKQLYQHSYAIHVLSRPHHQRIILILQLSTELSHPIARI